MLIPVLLSLMLIVGRIGDQISFAFDCFAVSAYHSNDLMLMYIGFYKMTDI